MVDRSAGHMGLSIWVLCVVMWGLALAIFAEGQKDTVYEVLKRHGLPVGLLPKGVKNYTLHDDGQLEVYLEKPCYTKFENQVYFASMIRGNLSYGQLAGVAGLEQQELFLWFPVKGIRVDIPNSGFIYFDVGVVYKQFILSLFEYPHDCKPVTNGDRRRQVRFPFDRLSQNILGKADMKESDISSRSFQ